MNTPMKREYNGWILCPSTRFPGKSYYFNPATGEAIWNSSDMDERRMLSRSNFAQPDKWYSYPEPEGPPEEASTPWCYPPDFRTFNQPSFGQPVFPKFTNYMESFAPNMSWGMPQPQMFMKSPRMSMHTFDPMPQMGPCFGPGPFKNFMQDKNLFLNNQFMPKVPFNQPMNGAVFPPRQRPMMPTFPPINPNKDMLKRRSMDSGKEPLLKKIKSQTDLRNESMFVSNNIFGTRNFENPAKETNQNHLKMPIFQQKNDSTKVCNCTMGKSKNLSSPFSKSTENLAKTETNLFTQKKDLNIQKPIPSRSKSLENFTEIVQSDVSSTLSLQGSFIFPLKKFDSKQCVSKSCENLTEPTSYSSFKKTIHNSTLSQSEQKNGDTQKNHTDRGLIETDLRYVLLAKKKNSSATETKETHSQGKKIKTVYSEDHAKLRENAHKKHVTFNLGVEDNDMEVEDDEQVANPGDELETAEPIIKYVIADIDALLTEFELIEEFILTEESYILLIPESTRRDIETVTGGLGGGARRRVTTARHITRRLADNPPHIQVEPECSVGATLDTGDLYLNCCLKKYDEGYFVTFISNNEALIEKALSLEIECYTTEQIREYLKTPPTNPFDFEKTQNEDQNSTKKPNSESTRQFFLENFNLKKNENQVESDEKSFLDKNIDVIEETNQLENEIKNLDLRDKNAMKNRRIVLASKKNEKKEQGDSVFQNGDSLEAKAASHTAKKKTPNINVYNLDGYLKCFSVKNEDMRDRITVKMDEYMCCFTQIMEDVLSELLKDVSRRGGEDTERPPIVGLLQDLRERVADHRTAGTLLDTLATSVDSSYARVTGRLTLKTDPNKFIKMFGCAILLMNVLNEIFPSSEPLSEGITLLEQLERSMEEWGAEPELPLAALCTPPPAAGAEQPRREFVKDPSEVLIFLQKHYPQWQSYQPAGNDNNNETAVQNNNDGVVGEDRHHIEDSQEKQKPASQAVIRTFGRNLGLLKLNPKKPLVFSCTEHTAANETSHKEKETEPKASKPKLIRKLAMESTNLPPKMREIDVEKRESDNEKLFRLLDDMLNCKAPAKPLTKLYDLKTIIIDKNSPKVDEKVNPKKPDIIKEIKDVRKIKAHSALVNINESKNENNVTKSFKQNKNTNFSEDVLDLEVLDYSAIEESITNNEQSLTDSSSNKLVIAESECNDVTTTQHNDSSPVDNGNEVNGNIDNDAMVVNDNDDSGIESEKAYCIVQKMLMTLDDTFKRVKMFIDTSIEDLKGGKRQEYIYLKAKKTRGEFIRIVNALNEILEWESDPQSCVGPLLAQGASSQDQRVAAYRQVIRKCEKEANSLLTSLEMVARMSGGDKHDRREQEQDKCTSTLK